MVTLPEYFDEFDNLFTEELSNTLVSIENSLYQVNYDGHMDDISHVFMDHDSLGNKDLGLLVLKKYKTHIQNVFNLQGIFLKDIDSVSMINLNSLLTAVSLLGTLKLSELVGDTLDKDMNADEYFSEIVSSISDLTTHDVMEMIDSIGDHVIDFLKNDSPTAFFISDMSAIAESRFKNCTISKPKLILGLLRTINAFGYNLQPMINLHILDLHSLTDNDEIAREIIYLVLGSDVKQNMLVSTMYEVSEIVSQNVSQCIKINSLIKTYSEEIKGD